MLAHDRSQEGRLAGAIGPDHSRRLAGRQLEVDAKQRLVVAVESLQTLHLEQGHSGAMPM